MVTKPARELRPGDVLLVSTRRGIRREVVTVAELIPAGVGMLSVVGDLIDVQVRGGWSSETYEADELVEVVR